MRPWIRCSALALALLAALAAALVAAGLVLAERRAARHIDVAVQPVALPTDATRSSTVVISTARAAAPTATAPTAAAALSFGARVAYVRSLPGQSGGAAVIELPLPARVLYGFGQIPDAAEKIDHTLAPSQPVAEGVNLEHGKYVANMCQGCHGARLEGGRIPGGPPDWPAARHAPGEGNAMARYADAAAFLAMLRSGKSPDGRALAVMPFEALSKMSATDARALLLYLTNLRIAP